MTSNGIKDIIQSAVQLNKDHQYALNVYAERLEAEVEAVDKLLVSLAHLERDCDHLNPFRTPPNSRKMSYIST
jgi:hypothetical protein